MIPDPLTNIERCRDDALRLVAAGGLEDADLYLVELSHMAFPGLPDDKTKALYALRDEAVRDINRAIEDAE